VVYADGTTNSPAGPAPRFAELRLAQNISNAGQADCAGEILAPTVILTNLEWLLLVLTLVCAGPMVSGRVPGSLVQVIAFGLTVVLPGLNTISLLIPNGAGLLFPAWLQVSRQGPHDIEVTDQRLIFALGQFLAFALSLIPATALAMTSCLARMMIADAGDGSRFGVDGAGVGGRSGAGGADARPFLRAV